LFILALTLLVLTGSASPLAFGLGRVPRWKVLISEAYAGRIDQKYSCATVHQAILRLPPTMLPYGSLVLRALHGYEKGAC
jgi:hypothetical protein